MTQAPASTAALHLASLAIHPVKSCGGLVVTSAPLMDTGLDWDRQWMVVDSQGEMLTQRDWPRLALVSTRLRGGDVVLRAPGMLALHLLLDVAEGPCTVRVWDDTVAAFDMGDLAAQWFSDYLGTRARLVRKDPEAERVADPAWTGEHRALAAFSDGFPLLVVGAASLAELNRRLQAAGEAPVAMDRFRANLVIDGPDLQPHDEDHWDTLTLTTAEGEVELKLVKPCARCSMPDINPATAEAGSAVARALAAYRSDARVGGAVTFGMNAIISRAPDDVAPVLRVGQAVTPGWAF